MEMMLVDGPAVRPFICVDGTQGGPVVDTLIQHHGYGRMYWSRRMVVEAARLYGMVEAEEHAAVLAAVGLLEEKLAAADGELAELQPVRDALVDINSRYEEPAGPVERSAPRRRAAA